MGIVYAPKSESGAVRDLYQKLYDTPYGEREDWLIELYERLDGEFLDCENEGLLQDDYDRLEERNADLVTEVDKVAKRVLQTKKAEIQVQLENLVEEYS